MLAGIGSSSGHRKSSVRDLSKDRGTLCQSKSGTSLVTLANMSGQIGAGGLTDEPPFLVFLEQGEASQDDIVSRAIAATADIFLDQAFDLGTEEVFID
jgi:hypothetical protein